MSFSGEPKHLRTLIVRDDEPYNAEPKLEDLIQHEITPGKLVYSRNHCPIQKLDELNFLLTINSANKEVKLTMNDLRSQFKKVDIVAALQCAGNRRATMTAQAGHETEGLQWTEGTLANCRWSGARLQAVLDFAGIIPQDRNGLHVCFASHATVCEQDGWFGASMPLEKALDGDGDVLLAYEMNGQSLPEAQGYPLRVVVPGYTGARWVKWLDTISISAQESNNYYQQRDYKVLPPQVQTHDAADSEGWWEKIPALMSNVLNSAVATVELQPTSGSSQERRLKACGYAVGGAQGGQVQRVEVSMDRGHTWIDAQITYKEGRWSWVLWEATLRIPPSEGQKDQELWSRAIDESGTVQLPECDWNLRGVAYNGYGRAKIPVSG